MPQSRIVILCGKGGVGKTTLSLSLALRFATTGKRVVVVTSHPLKELAVAVSLEGLAEWSPLAAQNLFVVHIDPKELLEEVVQSNFPAEWMARRVLNSDIYKNLIEVAPGLKEFYFLARMQALAERTAAGAPDYDLLLWDAPSTGHFLATLEAAHNFETFLTGPLAAAGAELGRFFSSVDRITVLPITTLEEMAIAETVEMCGKLQVGFHLQAKSIVLNMVSPLAVASDQNALDLQTAAAASSDPALHFAVERGFMERERTEEVRRRIPVPSVAVERVRRWSSDLDLLQQIGQSLGKLPVAA
ncbi:MAG: ArsA-related P-loop ATPase [Bryobacteraceae bacterium]